MTERNTRDQTRASREKVEDERIKVRLRTLFKIETDQQQLKDFNNVIKSLLQVYWAWNDEVASKDGPLLDLWDQLTDLPGVINDVERQLSGK
jgi:hypothetical protein